MKYLILVGDGMGDRPVEELDGRTPLQAAATPRMDRLAATGALGRALTIPQGMEAGSDVANMSLMGYDPGVYHTGRSPIEAAAMGLDLGPEDTAFRCNLVTLEHRGERVYMSDYSAGHIATPAASELIAAVEAALGREGLHFHAGVSYRHCLVWHKGPLDAETVPPHDFLAQDVTEILGRGGSTKEVSDLNRASWPILQDHPYNLQRRGQGLAEANSIWLWGQGTKPQLPSLAERFGLTGLVISAVDLLKGLGVLSGMEVVEVPGATGWIDTNYAGKVSAALDGLWRHDLAFVHVEAPDEAGHSGVAATKVEAIEAFDAQVVGPLLEGLAGLGEHRVLLATDHYTPLSVRTHTPEPVPYVIWDSRQEKPGAAGFNEAAAAGLEPIAAHDLLARLVEAK